MVSNSKFVLEGVRAKAAGIKYLPGENSRIVFGGEENGKIKSR